MAEPAGYTIKYCRLDAQTVKATISLTQTDSASSGNAQPSSNTTITPIVVLDISGSMQQDSRFQKCTAFINVMLQECAQIELVTFNDKAKNLGVISTFPSNLVPDNQTNFQDAYITVLSAIQRRHKSTQAVGSIVFLSDGGDNMSNNARRDAGAFGVALHKLAQSHGIAFTVHSIGVDAAEADAQLLIDLSRCAPVEGSFGSFGAPTGDRYTQAVTSSKIHMEEAKRLVLLVMGTSNATLVDFRGKKIALTPTQPSDTVYFQDTKLDCEAGTIYDEIDYCAFQLAEMTSNVASLLIPNVVAFRERIHKIFVLAGKPPYRSMERKMIRQRLDPLNALVTQIYDALHANGKNGKMSNTVISNLNVAAREARQGTKGRFVRVAVDRMVKNTELIEQEDLQILELVKQNVLPTAEETALLDTMTCIISQCTATELLVEGDCIGVGVKVDADQNCMFDPTRLKVQGVGVHFIAASEFLSIATYAGNVSFDDATSVYKDPTGVEVSGVLPLYVNESHWKIARLHARRMASHLCCKDPLMGTPGILFWTYMQVITHLVKTHKEGGGQKWSSIIDMLQKTIQVIYAENPRVIPKPETFLTSVASRLSSCVLPAPKRLLDAYRRLHVSFDESALRPYVDEETLRRASTAPKTIGQFFQFERATYVDAFVKSQTREPSTGQMSLLPAKMSKLIETVSETYNQEVVDLIHSVMGKMVRGEYEVDEATGEVIDYGEAFDVLDAYEPVALPLPGEKIPKSFCGYSHERLALILLQLSANANETSYVASYRDWHAASEQQVREVFVKKVIDYIRLERTSALSQVISSQQDDETSKTIAFLNGSNVSLLERVAMMHGSCYIGRNVSRFSTTVCDRQEEQMLVEGKYDIAPLIGYQGGPVIVQTLMDRNQRGWLPATYQRHRLRRRR